MNDITSSASGDAQIVTAVMDRWRQGIDSGRPDTVSALFTTDALFQGLRPQPLHGRDGVAEYYSAQPPGLRARYTIVQTKRPADSVVVAYLDAEFEFSEGTVIPAHLTVVMVAAGAEWLITHYHVSR
ncbi:MAG: nuclear transport factor 2 family protein [Actinobacteria bacterium]|nr:nuclear transport factor 2 family protein [Actinomycetota bacterium]